MKLKCDELLSAFAFKFNLRRYTKAELRSFQGEASVKATELENELRAERALRMKLENKARTIEQLLVTSSTTC